MLTDQCGCGGDAALIDQIKAESYGAPGRDCPGS